MDLIKVSQLDPSTEITENDLIMVVREINGTKYSFKTNVKSLLDKVNYDLATDVTGKPALVGAQNTDYMPIIRKVGQSVTAYKITTEELVKLSKFDFPKTVNDSSSLSTLEDTDLIAIVRNETNGGTVRKITYKNFKDLVGKVKTVQGIEPDTAGNITLMNSKHYNELNATLTIPVDLSKITETFSVNITRSAFRTINIPKPDLTNVKEANIVNYTAYVVVKNTMVAVFNTRFIFPNGSTVYFQGSLIDSGVALELPNRNILLCIKYGPNGEIYVVDHTKGMVDKVAGVAPDISGNVNPFIRTGIVSGSTTQLNIGNAGTASWFSTNANETFKLWAPASTDYVGSELYLVVDATALQSGSLTTLLMPGTVILHDSNGQRLTNLPNDQLTIQSPAGMVSLYRFTYLGNQKVFFENVNTPAPLADLGTISYQTPISAKQNIMAACSLKESMMDAVLTVADRWSNPESRYVLNLSGWNNNNLPSSPNGSTFIFSVMLDSASVAGSDVMPITVGGPSLKLLDKTGTEIDKAGAIKAYRGVKTWYKFTLYKNKGIVLEKMFVSDQVTVNGAVADGNNDVKISKPATTLISSGGTSQTYKPNFKGLIDTLIIYPGQQSISATIDLTFPTGEFPPTGWCLNIVLDTLSGEDGGQQSSTSTASISWKTNTGYIVNSSAALVKNSEAGLFASWSRKSYIDVVHLGNGIFKITNTYPGALYKEYTATRHQTQVITFKPPATSLVETWAAGLLDVGITQNVILDLDDIVRIAQPGYRFIFRVSNVVYVINGTGVVTPQGTIPDQNRFELAINKTYECVKVPNAPGSLAQNGPTVIIKDIGHFSDKKKTTVYASNKLAEIVFDTSENQVHEYRLNAGSGETFAIKLADAVGPANDDWEAILSMDTYLVNTSTLRILGGNAVFDGEVRANTDTSAILFERFMPQNRERRIKVTRPSAARGGWIFTTLNPMHGKKSVNITTNGSLSFRPDYGIDEDIVYCAALTGSTFTIDIKDWDYTKLPMNYRVRVFINANSNAKLVFNSQSIYNGESKGQTIIDVSGLNVFDLLNIGYGAPMIVKVG